MSMSIDPDVRGLSIWSDLQVFPSEYTESWRRSTENPRIDLDNWFQGSVSDVRHTLDSKILVSTTQGSPSNGFRSQRSQSFDYDVRKIPDISWSHTVKWVKITGFLNIPDGSPDLFIWSGNCPLQFQYRNLVFTSHL